MAAGVPSAGCDWATPLVPFILSAQEHLAAAEQVARHSLAIATCASITFPVPGQKALSEMDVVDASMTDTLKALGRLRKTPSACTACTCQRRSESVLDWPM